MPQFIDVPAEQTTAATDLLLALVALACTVYLARIGRAQDGFKTAVWCTAFGLLVFAAALGAVAHGFKMSQTLRRALWQPLNLALGLAIALFVVGVVYDRWGLVAARRLLPVLLAVGVVFFLVTVFVPGTFLVFILYEAVAALFALAVFLLIAAGRSGSAGPALGRLPGAWWMAAGVAISIVAAAIQALGFTRVSLFWEFDHNGVFHLVQVAGVLVLTVGLRAALLGEG